MCRYVFDFIFFDKNILIEKRCPIVWAIQTTYLSLMKAAFSPFSSFRESTCLQPLFRLVSFSAVMVCELVNMEPGHKKDLLDKGQHQVSRKSNPDPILSFLFIKNGTLYASII